nr:hypothetical protein [Dyella sp. ASV24]
MHTTMTNDASTVPHISHSRFAEQHGSSLLLVADNDTDNNKKLITATDSARAGGGDSAH